MSNDGIIGLNLTDQGLSRENIQADSQAMGGAWSLVRNSPDMTRMLRADGVRVIARFAGDDPEGNPMGQNPEEFARVRRAAVDAGTYIHLTNEIDPPSHGRADDLNQFTIKAMQTLDEIGGCKGVILNLSTHKSVEQYAMVEPSIEYAVEHGHPIGIHIYEKLSKDLDAYNWLPMFQKHGGLWIVTEYGYIENPSQAYAGWRGRVPELLYVNQLNGAANRFDVWEIPVLVFSYEHWPNNQDGVDSGFGIIDAPEIKKGIAAINNHIKWNETSIPLPPVQPPVNEGFLQVPVNYVNLRLDPQITSNNVIGRIEDNQPVRVIRDMGEWLEVETTSTRRGYVYKQQGSVYVTPKPDGG